MGLWRYRPSTLTKTGFRLKTYMPLSPTKGWEEHDAPEVTHDATTNQRDPQ